MSNTDFFDDDLAKRKSSARATSIGQEGDAHGISDLNLTRMARHRQEVSTQVASAKVEIERLRQRQEDLEREKHAMEELRQKQDEYERGRQEMLDRLTAKLTQLEQMESHAVRLTEIYSATRKRFVEIRQDVQGINDANWPDDMFREEMNKAVVLIDNYRKEFVKALATVEAASGAEGETETRPQMLFDGESPLPASVPRGFGAWVKIGFAVSLPLMVVLILVTVAILVAAVR